MVLKIGKETLEFRETTVQNDELHTGSLDFHDEDLHNNDQAPATGFVERNPESEWLRAVEMAQSERTDGDASGFHQRRGSYAPNNRRISSYSFWPTKRVLKSTFASIRMSYHPWRLPRDFWAAT